MHEFQSTPPVREATGRQIAEYWVVCEISIHASREGGDLELGITQVPILKVFQSTPPVREATRPDKKYQAEIKISIHASREGGDPGGAWAVGIIKHFNPRLP